MRAPRLIAILSLVQALAGCSVWHKFMDDDEEPVKSTDDVVAEAEKADKAEKPEKGLKGAKSTQKDEQELKLARLWARVDELEEQGMRNKERIRVLEKGITLGLVPEELKGDGKKKSAPIVKEPLFDEHAPPKGAAKAPDKKEEATNEAMMSKEQADQYQAALAVAHELYRSGRYGRAIVEYDKIGKDFAGKVDGGMHKYWIGKCWSNLKEYSTARQIFVDFITENAGSAWIPRAKLELARVEWKVGMQDTALQRFKEIIQAYPYEDAAEMAKMELENLGKTL